MLIVLTYDISFYTICNSTPLSNGFARFRNVIGMMKTYTTEILKALPNFSIEITVIFNSRIEIYFRLV